MKLAIMQPYFFPYLGYWQLINAVDRFIILDDVQFTKKGWINRNRILMNGSVKTITLPIMKGTRNLDIKDRSLSFTNESDKLKILNQIKSAYYKAPEFGAVYPIIQSAINNDKTNLSEYLFFTIKSICEYLEIDTKFYFSSDLKISPLIKGQEKILKICKINGASEYINPIGGVNLYNRDEFMSVNLKLSFLETNPLFYNQFDSEFISDLSVIDLLMFNSKSEVKKMLSHFKLR
jgi:hypothetical protein